MVSTRLDPSRIGKYIEICQWTYHIEYTSSCPITEVTQHWVTAVLGWEHWMLLAFNFCKYRFDLSGKGASLPLNKHRDLWISPAKSASILSLVFLKALLFSNDQKRIRGARKMSLFTILVELWYYDSWNLCSKKGSFSEHLYGQC